MAPAGTFRKNVPREDTNRRRRCRCSRLPAHTVSTYTGAHSAWQSEVGALVGYLEIVGKTYTRSVETNKERQSSIEVGVSDRSVNFPLHNDERSIARLDGWW